MVSAAHGDCRSCPISLKSRATARSPSVNGLILTTTLISVLSSMRRIASLYNHHDALLILFTQFRLRNLIPDVKHEGPRPSPHNGRRKSELATIRQAAFKRRRMPKVTPNISECWLGDHAWPLRTFRTHEPRSGRALATDGKEKLSPKLMQGP